MDDKKDITPGECSYDCSSCPSSYMCDTEGESGPSFFDRLEAISERFDDIGEENLIDMLNEAVAALEAEEEADESQEPG